MDLTPEYIEFKKKIETQRKLVARKQAVADKQKDILKSMLVNCKHEETEHKTSYFRGSYTDLASTDHWYECTLCGRRSPIRTETHSYYG